MRFDPAQPPFTEIVCGRYAKIFDPKKVRSAILCDSVKKSPLPGRTIIIRISLVLGPAVCKALVSLLVKPYGIGLFKSRFIADDRFITVPDGLTDELL